jgi:hypothetical protein
MPADFIATSSYVSPRLPKVMSEESKTASGRANGTKAALWYMINSKIIPALNPLPTKSSMYNQKNCNTNTKSVMKKVATKGPTNALVISLSSFLNTEPLL